VTAVRYVHIYVQSAQATMCVSMLIRIGYYF